MVKIRPNGLVEYPTPAPFPFGPSTIADILVEGVKTHPDRLALIDRHQRREWTWRELDQRVAELAAGLVANTVYAHVLRDDADKILLALAVWRAGGIMLFSSVRNAPVDAIAQLGPVETIRSLADLGTAHSGEPQEIDPFAPAAVAATSGTSGTPKLVVHSQRSLLIPPLVSMDVDPPSPSERILTPLDCGILNVMVLGPLSSLARGSTSVLPNKVPNGPNWVSATRIQEVTRLVVVPAQLDQMVVQTDSGHELPKLERVLVGGSGADPAQLARFEERFGVRPTPSYGLTEAPTGVVRASLKDQIGARRGFPLPHVDVSIHGDDGRDLGVGVEGQIWLSPARTGRWANVWTPALGYLGDPGKTRVTFEGGVLKTGDKGLLDVDGGLSVAGRLSDDIIRGGMNLDPVAIERALLEDPEVSDALVVGIADDRLGQRVGAVVARANPESIDGERLRAHVCASLSPHHVPDVIISARKLTGPERMGKRPRHLPDSVFRDGDRDLRGSLNLADGRELRAKRRLPRPQTD